MTNLLLMLGLIVAFLFGYLSGKVERRLEGHAQVADPEQEDIWEKFRQGNKK